MSSPVEDGDDGDDGEAGADGEADGPGVGVLPGRSSSCTAGGTFGASGVSVMA